MGKPNQGFNALLATQFFGAFNDNAFKFVIAAIVVDLIDSTTGGTLFLSLTGAIFILPFIVFAMLAGYLADRYSKQKVIVGVKILELVVMAFGFWALLQGSIVPMLIVLFFMGFQSTLLSPSKYGILPEILKDEDLSAGNGVLQMWTYVAILLGQTSYGFIMHYTAEAPHRAAYFFVFISVLGIITSFFVPKVKPSGSTRPLQFNFLKEITHNIRWIKKDRGIFLSILGLTYFGFLGGLFQPNILLFARKILEVTHLQTGILISAMTIGVGLGCVMAGKLSNNKVELGLVPLGSIGLSVFSILLGFSAGSYVMSIVVVFLLGVSCGFYIVPLNTLIQRGSPVDKRGQVLATNTFCSFTAILIGSLCLYVLRDLMHLNAAQIFIFTGFLTIAGTSYIISLLPYALVRFVIWMITHTIYRIKTIGGKNIPDQGGALLVCNHISYVDALMLVVTTQRPIRFMVYRNIYNMRGLRGLFRLGNAIPISGKDNPKEVIRSLKIAQDALKNGELVCIFPEGQLTRTGNMLKFNRGMEKIMKDVDVPIIPVHLDRVWGSIFSYERGKYFYKMPKMIPYPITVSYGEAMSSDSSVFAVRNRILELGADSFPQRLNERLTLPEHFWQEARKHPRKFCSADSMGKSLTYGKTLIGSVVLKNQLKSKLKDQNNIGILLPPSIGGVLTNLAVSMLNKVPINLNYTSSKETLASITQQCEMKSIITSKKFMTKVKLELPFEPIYIEDIMRGITSMDKVKAMITSFAPRAISYRMIFGSKHERSINDLATIMFTSGSTGEPKGVMLTHANIMSNLEGLYQTFHVRGGDTVLGILPFFHSFGFTATMWFPLISGIGAVYHVNPMDAKTIGELVHKHQATILMSTPTFLNAYIRKCDAEQFKSLRTVVVGAEKLKDQIAQAFKEKFNIDVMEGYGCTELSPIVSINLPDYRDKGVRQKTHKPGSIGLPLPGIAVKVLNPDTGQPLEANENGLLFIKGPNVMHGYLNRDALTEEVIQNGWYQTGDIAHIDNDGFLSITDRLSRFSKIGGEMVPHIKVEEHIQSAMQTSEPVCAVTSVADDKKGERLAVVHTAALKPEDVVNVLKQSELPNLWIPNARDFVEVEEIPVLGTGKLDLGTVKKIARTRLEKVGDD